MRGYMFLLMIAACCCRAVAFLPLHDVLVGLVADRPPSFLRDFHPCTPPAVPPFLALAAAFPASVLAAQIRPRASAWQTPSGLPATTRSTGPRPTRRPSPILPLVPLRSRRDEPSALQEVATTLDGKGLAAGDYLAKFWELDPADKRGTFVVRTWLRSNFPLPAALFDQHQLRALEPDVHPDGGTFPQYRQTDELQRCCAPRPSRTSRCPTPTCAVVHAAIDLADVERPGLGAVPAATTSRGLSYRADPRRDGRPGRWPALAHGAVGRRARVERRGLPLSRSWNYAYLGTAFTHDDITPRARFNQRLGEQGVDDNPHITDYIGNTELSAAWLPGETTMQLTAYVVQVSGIAAR